MSSIITSATLNSYMHKTLPADVANLIVAGVNQHIENVTNRSWGDVSTVTETYNWGKTLYLRHQDIVEIISIKVGWPGQTQTTLDEESYFFNKLGRVTMFWQAGSRANSSPAYNDYVEVEYKHGNLTVPDDLVQAALALASRAYTRSTQSEQDIAQAKVGSYDVRFNSQPATGSNTPALGSPDAVIASYAMRKL